MRNPNPSVEEFEQYPTDDTFPLPPHPPLPHPPTSQAKSPGLERLRMIKDAFANKKQQLYHQEEELSEYEFVMVESDGENEENEGMFISISTNRISF
jgi:hypothetical protein